MPIGAIASICVSVCVAAVSAACRIGVCVSCALVAHCNTQTFVYDITDIHKYIYNQFPIPTGPAESALFIESCLEMLFAREWRGLSVSARNHSDSRLTIR